MTLTGLGLGAACAARHRRRAARGSGRATSPLGLASAAALYGTFRVGDRFARRIVPSGDAEIGDIYALRSSAEARDRRAAGD